ncbi:type II toxin-antitoxin system RelE/ParE family toxin [Candidatus Vondammii sp. HM_W22]|uniref:type II toxin-antitoxin system RelE/ParE family toxin n=1 Tax=Candidatus Vondammii sp. HM_W22 TaxID=2687299 RepID=UPI001F1350DB|nr:type II toxin-antitoxin system RelE/ParE family toxin [Candidatus Vondammii sp. HM_W22]
MKRYQIIIMPSAREGLLAIGEYIALDNPVRAIIFVDEITSSLEKTLSIFPFSGKISQELDLGEEIRVWSHANYNSYYRILDDKQIVEVLFIFNASRDVGSLITSL